MTEHIDNDRLHVDIKYRFDYFSKFIHFTTEDISALNIFASSAISVIPVISDSVYRKLFQYDITKDYFIIQNDVFDGSSIKNENLSLDSAQIIYRKDMLSGYLKRLLLQREWTNEFLTYLSRIGRMHTTLNKVFRIQNDLFLMYYVESLQDNSSIRTTNHEKRKCICS
ncbi:unnamed protein product [Rotaria sordida]|uniref:Globin-sensor domain-containing protein n=1 Tax=Rotaria sordida TaxID=392033 RepID=A0A819TK28_9BILA|nr:unnamed protein product [Rotaria sordida]